ncbi:MAG: CbbQ/NirQ/NorQ/GpvN family protein [Pseudomonadales bacterium]|nr:CbbQ/NirQ/NorQ/GpvN family protein [Pseudomonadales bacterium]
MSEIPYYLPLADEVEIFLSAYKQKLPVLLKGPTGCGKTRFVEYMTHLLYRGDHADQNRKGIDNPLQTVACHEDLSATDLVGRFLLHGDETVWQDGPLSKSVKDGAICYLDEIVEARKDSTVLIHSLTDHRRILPVEKLGITLKANDDFLLVISYNPGYQSVLKDLKPSTRQRFIAIDFDYPNEENEAAIIEVESRVGQDIAIDLARLGARVRRLKNHGFDDGVSTRLLVYAGKLIKDGLSCHRACEIAVSQSVSDDKEIQTAINELTAVFFPSE